MWRHSFSLFLACLCSAADGTITTIAGAGPNQRDVTDGRMALDAALGEVHALAFDGEGGLLVGSQRLVVRVRADGRVGVVAGVGTPGLDGWPGSPVPAAQMPIGVLRGIARGQDGSVYISDAGQHSVRRLGRDGQVTTLISMAAGYLSPRALAIDSGGQLFVAVLGRSDASSHRGMILRVSPAGEVTELEIREADGTPGLLRFPEGLTFGPEGALYVTEFGGHRVRRIADGVVTTIAGTGVAGLSGDGGPAVEARLSGPSSVAVAGDGTVYIADTLNARIRRVGPDGRIETMDWNTESGRSSYLNQPAHVLLESGSQSLFVAEYGANRVRRIRDGQIARVAGSGERLLWQEGSGIGQSALLARLNYPEGIASCGGFVYVADTRDSMVLRIGREGRIEPVTVPDGSALAFRSPSAVACDGGGNLYVADRGSPRILKVSPDGTMVSIYGDGTTRHPYLRDPRGVAVDRGGNVYIAERALSRVLKVAQNGAFTVLWSGQQGIDFPYAITMDSSGRPVVAVNRDRASRVFRLELSGSAVPIVESLSFVNGLAFGEDGRLYLTDIDSVYRLEADGTVSRIAGVRNGSTSVPLGDGGSLLDANLNGISGIAAADGVLYVTQVLHNRVRRIAN